MGMNQLSCNNQTVSQVMANAAALIAAKKQKEKELAMKKEAEHRRQMQQREMTPDNLKIVEQKLLEFQKQQGGEEEVGSTFSFLFTGIFSLPCEDRNAYSTKYAAQD